MKPLQGDRETVILRKCYGQMVSRHKKKQFIGPPVTLQEFVFLVKQPCCYCGHVGSNKKYDHKSAGELHSHVVVRVNGLDRVDNNQGYTLSNSVSCYHGSVDETFATLDDAGNTIKRPGNLGAPVDLAG